LFVSSNAARASIDYNTDGAIYTQNFDSLPNTPENVSLGSTPAGWLDDSTTPAAGQFSIQGWYLFHPILQTEGGANGHQRMRIGAGTATTGAFMSFGSSASTERALGTLNSNTLAVAGGNAYFGMRLTNNTGNTIYGFTLSYDGEQWRDGGNATPASETDIVQYALGATGIQDTPSYINVGSGADFTSPVNNTSAAAVNGNTTGKVSVGPVTVSDIAWQPGQDLWIRWVDTNAAGNDHGMAIDNVNFVASVNLPEPATAGLLAIGALFGLRRARRAAR
jgi:hypothetical protein